MEVKDIKDNTLRKRLQKVFSEMTYLSEALMFVLENAYVLKLQVRDASDPDRVLWEKLGKLIYDRKTKNIVPYIDGLPITITLGDLLRAFKSEIEVAELPVFLCWEFQAGNYKRLCFLPGTEDKLIIVSPSNPIRLS